jgi:hypothetical protein
VPDQDGSNDGDGSNDMTGTHAAIVPAPADETWRRAQACGGPQPKKTIMGLLT